MEVTAGPVVFVPVSGPEGAGEYYRCLAVARAMASNVDTREIHFVLSRSANVTRDDRFHYHLLDGSPTHSTKTVCQLFKNLQPAAVIFDSSIRTAQLRYAGEQGARVICLVSRESKRRKLLRPHKLRHIDTVWIVGALLTRQRLGRIERLFTRGWPGKIRFGGVVLPGVGSGVSGSAGRGGYILVVPGGGGGTVDGQPVQKLFSDIAARLGDKLNLPVRFVAGPLSRLPLPDCRNVEAARQLDPDALVDTMRQARVAVLGGGSLLLQGLAIGLPIVALPAGGKDQPRRCANLAKEELVHAPIPSTAGEAAAAAAMLWEDTAAREALEQRVRSSGYTDAGPEIARDILEGCVRPETGHST